MVFCRLCKLTIFMNNLATCETLIVFLHVIKCAIWLNRSTIAKIELWPLMVHDNLMTTFILRSSRGWGTGKDVYCPVFSSFMQLICTTLRYNATYMPLETRLKESILNHDNGFISTKMIYIPSNMHFLNNEVSKGTIGNI